MNKIAFFALCALLTLPTTVLAETVSDSQQKNDLVQDGTVQKAPVAEVAAPSFDGVITSDDVAAVYLEPVETSAPKDTVTRVSKSDMDLFDARNLVDAIKNTPGVTHGISGGRNEQTIKIRGFDQRQVPIYLNGMPLYTPYDGYAEVNMLQTFDLESVEISKGYTSSLLGANNMGGAINMRMAKPKKKFEFETRYINDFDRKFDDQGRLATMSVGTKQDKFYLRANGLYKRQDYFRLSHDFDATQWQDDGKRENSMNQDKKFSAILGITPTKDADVYVTYIKQKSEKEQPIEVNGWKRYWRWPQWDKESVMLNGDFSLSPKAYMKTMLFYDSYDNKMNDYRDIDFSEINTQSKYRDFSYGGRMELGYTFNEMHKIAISGLYKHDRHRRIDSDYFGGKKSPKYDNWRTGEYQEDIWSLGAEYTFNPVKELTFVLGTNFNILNPRKAETFGWNNHGTNKKPNWEFEQVPGVESQGDTTAWDYQLGVFYDVTDKDQIYGTFAKKTRFANIKERYTSGFDGTKVPNPYLDPEEAYNWELGYRGTWFDMFKVNLALFYSDVKDLIDSVDTGVMIGSGSSAKSQTMFDNVNKVHFYGYEAGLEAYFNEYVSVGGNYSYLEWDNRSSDARLTDRPRHSASAYTVVTPIEGLKLVPRMEYMSQSYNNSSGSPKSDELLLAHFKASYDITDNFAVEAGVRNLFDKNVELSDGYPMEGRTFFTGVKVTF